MKNKLMIISALFACAAAASAVELPKIPADSIAAIWPPSPITPTHNLNGLKYSAYLLKYTVFPK